MRTCPLLIIYLYSFHVEPTIKLQFTSSRSLVYASKYFFVAHRIETNMYLSSAQYFTEHTWQFWPHWLKLCGHRAQKRVLVRK